jgi:hypothetical protein
VAIPEETAKYDLATEVLSSAVRILRAAGFAEDEIPKLFEQVVKKERRAPIWITPVEKQKSTSIR